MYETLTTRQDGRARGGVRRQVDPSKHAPHAVENPWNALWAMMVGFFMILVDATIVAVANPSIMDKLGADYDAVIWVTSAYLLGLRGAAAGGRPPRRPVRAEEPLPAGPDGVHRRIAVVRPGRHHRNADRCPRRAGHRRGAAHAADAVDHHPDLPGRAPRRGDERVGCHRRGGDAGRSAGRRRAGRSASAGSGSSSSTCRSASSGLALAVWLVPVLPTAKHRLRPTRRGAVRGRHVHDRVRAAGGPVARLGAVDLGHSRRRHRLHGRVL